MYQMASLRQGMQRSLSSCTRSALMLGKSSKSSRYQAPLGGGPIGLQCTRSQTCGPKLSDNATRNAISPPRDFSTAAPFTTKCNASASIRGSRSCASQRVRLGGEVAVIQSLMPYFSATADSRLVSRLGTTGDVAILQDDEDGT